MCHRHVHLWLRQSTRNPQPQETGGCRPLQPESAKARMQGERQMHCPSIKLRLQHDSNPNQDD